MAAPYGAELLHSGSVAKALNGDDDHELAVVVKFPSLERIVEWYGSKAYQSLVRLRDQGSDMQMTSYEMTT